MSVLNPPPASIDDDTSLFVGISTLPMVSTAREEEQQDIVVTLTFSAPGDSGLDGMGTGSVRGE